ncbi:Hypp4621 [Branchiostoma lanceolatum]|uniref:Hypp4621 protein n=1 Tax=Branchiostoma lanceolatum TaxID=7740 RepID=A0A8K0EYK9_BRALA|nr:Hypp4621 [Branchiostoma lanceolatum]
MSDMGADTDSLGTGEEGSPASTRKKHRQPKKKTLARLKAMKKNAMGSNESLGNSSQADSERGHGSKEEEKGDTKPDLKDSTSLETGEKNVENSEESKPKPKPRRRFKELVQSGDEADRNSLSDFEGKHSPRPPSKPKPPTRKFGSTDSLKSSSSVDVENKSQGLNLPKKTASDKSSTDSAVTRAPRPGQWRGPIEPKVTENKPAAVALSDYSSDEGVETKKDNKRGKDLEQKGSNSTGNTSKETASPGKGGTPEGNRNKGNQDADKQVMGGSSSTGGGDPVTGGSSSDDDVVISTSKPKSGGSEPKEQKTKGYDSSQKSSHVNDRTAAVSGQLEMSTAKDSNDSDGSIPDMVPELEARLTAKLKVEDKGPKTSTPLKRQSSSLTSDTSSLVSVTSESSSENDDLFSNYKEGSNRLEPLKASPNLPLLEGNVSSQSLRTTIKTEFPMYSLYHGERANSMPGLNAQLSRTESDMSVMSFQSVSALPMIQTRAARDR